MFKKILAMLSGLVLALTLTACPSAGTNQNEPVWFGTIPAHASTNQDILLKSGLSGDLIYFELGEGVQAAGLGSSSIGVVGNLKLYVTEQNGTKLFSHRPDVFSKVTAKNSLQTNGIVVKPVKTECRGPCVIENYAKIENDFKVNVKIQNDNNFAVKFKLFAFVAKSADKNEPNGSAQCKAVVRPASVLGINPTPKKPIVIKGALEFMGDVDCFSSSDEISEVRLQAASANSTGSKAVIWDKETHKMIDSITLLPGTGSKIVSVGNKKINVYVSTVNLAGPAKHSSYTLTLK